VCGRYTQTAGGAQLAETFPEVRLLPSPGPGFERYNVAPTQQVVALGLDRVRDRERVARLLRWGLVPGWAKDLRSGARMINARSETVATRPAFRGLVARAERRCLVLADGFYEWQRGEDPKVPRIPFRYTVDGGRPFAFAGLWTAWRPRDEPDAAWVRTCTILTTDANALVAPVHDRMPVMLADPDRQAAWLDPALDGAGVAPLLVPLDPGRMAVAAASTRVNDARNEGPDLLAAEAPATR